MSLPYPGAVVKEVGAKPDGAPIFQVLTHNPESLAGDWGAGESQVIANARRHGADRVPIDDLQARRCATSMGIEVIGTLGVVGRARSAGQIERAAPVIARPRQTRLYVSDELVQRLLQEVGE